MNFELNTRTYLLGILVVFGMSVELLKLWPSASAITAHTVTAIEDHLFSSKPYAMSDKSLHKTIAAPKPVLKMQSIPNFDMNGAVEKFGKEQEKVLADTKKNEEAAKDWHWVWNKKLGQWVWKKKSDKKESPEAKATAVVQMPTIPLVAPTAASADSTNGGGATLGGGNTAGSGALAPGGTAATNFLSQSEWEALLLKTPNAAETTKFVQAYLNHMVTEGVFYAIVGLMLKDSRVDMQQQGVTALSMTPSVESFVLLAQQGQAAQTSSPVSTAVTTALSAYAQTKNLSTLQSILKTQTNNTVLAAALTQLQNSINTNLRGSGPNPTAQGGGNASSYQAFVAILNGLMSNNAVASQAQTILGSLNGIAMLSLSFSQLPS